MKRLMKSIKYASYHPFVRAFLWLFVLFILTFASVHYPIIRLYYNNIEKPYRQKHRQSVCEYFPTIFWADSTCFLKVGLGEGTVTSPLSPLLSCSIFILRTKIRSFILSQTLVNVLTTYKNC